MKNTDDFINTSLELCNYWAIFSNIIVIIVCVILIIFFYKDFNTHTETKAEITKVENDKCEKKSRNVHTRYGNHIEDYYECDLTVDYNINSEKFSNSLITKDSNNYKKNDHINIEYLNIDKNNIRLSQNSYDKIIIIFSILLIIISIITTFIRLFFNNKPFVKWFIGITCLRNLFSSSY